MAICVAQTDGRAEAMRVAAEVMQTVGVTSEILVSLRNICPTERSRSSILGSRAVTDKIGIDAGKGSVQLRA